MTDAERYVNQTCERVVASGHVWLYRDLYRDLRERLPCGATCRLLEEGLRLTRLSDARRHAPDWRRTGSRRARAIAALRRLGHYAWLRERGMTALRNGVRLEAM